MSFNSFLYIWSAGKSRGGETSKIASRREERIERPREENGSTLHSDVLNTLFCEATFAVIPFLSSLGLTFLDKTSSEVFALRGSSAPCPRSPEDSNGLCTNHKPCLKT